MVSRSVGRIALTQTIGPPNGPWYVSAAWSMAHLHAHPARPAPRLLARQRQLLHLLDALGSSFAGPDFVHLLVLYCEEASSKAPYAFVPHREGAFSFTLEADRRKLSEIGLLEDGDAWAMTEAGRDAIGRVRDLKCAAFVRRHHDLHGDRLLSEVFRRQPRLGTRTALAERVLQDDEASRTKLAEARRVPFGGGLATVGYEGHSVESYLNVLLQGGVTLLCDVRHNPLSRKSGFSKGPLGRACAMMGIAYEHLPELGIASAERQRLETAADYSDLFAKYERDWHTQQESSVERIVSHIRKGERVALTCYERDVSECHRGVVAKRVLERLKRTPAPDSASP